MAGLSARLALVYRRRQAFLSARLISQVAQLWRGLANPRRIDANWDVLRVALEAQVRQARNESVALARAAYLEARTEAGLHEPFTLPEPSPLRDDRLASSLDVTGPIQFKQAIAAGKSPQQAIDVSAVRLAGSAQYLALEGGRDVMEESIQRDERATGYSRVTDGDPCAWCAMLASRGPVYKTAVTAGDPRQGGNRYHDHCACQAWPAFTLDEPFVGIADQLYEHWRRETRGKGGKDAVNAFRRWWEAEGRANYTPPVSP